MITVLQYDNFRSSLCQELVVIFQIYFLQYYTSLGIKHLLNLC